MKRLLASLLILSVSLLMGYFILSLWKAVSLYRGNPSREDLLRATEIAPSNPDPYYRLALYYQWNVENVDLKESLQYLKKAIERNPLEQEYWLNLAKVLQRLGRRDRSQQAMERALFVYPAGYTGRWTVGTLLLQQGDYEGALPHFSYILAHYPNEGSLVYDILTQFIDNTDFILENLVPKNPSSLNQYLHYLYEIGDKEGAIKAWAKKATLGYRSDRKEALRHIDFLISQGELGQAYRVWEARLKEEGLSISTDGNLITNGRFERENVLGGGFDWRIHKITGAEIAFDPSIAFEGKGSLKVRFDGKENVDFQHVYQFVAWKPNTEYLLKARMKTREVTTKSGIKLEVFGIGPAFYQSSDSLTGDNAWKELQVTFRTPSQSQGGIVRIRRVKTDKFDRFISGTVWIDHVELKER